MLSDPSIFDATRLSDDVTLAFAPFLYPSTGALALVAPGCRWPDVFSIEWSDADCLLCAPGICDGDAPRPPLAPPALPPPPPSPPPDFTAPITIGVVGAVAVVILLLSLWRWQYKKRKRAVRHAVQNEEETARVREAVAATATLTHAAALVRASDFVELGKLQTYEDMRDRGALVYKDNVDALAHPSVTYLFLSHQWTSWVEPDPTGKQYAAMVSAVQSVVAAEGWRLAETLVWCDYFSIPQRCLSEQEAAIKSLVSFASCASAFVAVAPPVPHAQTGAMCDLASYRARMWCRAEMLAYSLRNGSAKMYCCSDADGSARQTLLSGVDDEHTSSLLDVFTGEASVEEDKLKLVLPILGLYAELVASVSFDAAAPAPLLKSTSSGRPLIRMATAPNLSPSGRRSNPAKGSVPASGADSQRPSADAKDDGFEEERAAAAHATARRQILHLALRHKDQIFPREATFKETAASRAIARAHRVNKPRSRSSLSKGSGGFATLRRMATGVRKNTMTKSAQRKLEAAAAGVTLPLFGGMVEVLERLLVEDEALRKGLAKRYQFAATARVAKIANRASSAAIETAAEASAPAILRPTKLIEVTATVKRPDALDDEAAPAER